MSTALTPIRRSRRLRAFRTRSERGAATAEYAVTIVAACGLGGILVSLLKSDVMLNALKALINYALKLAGVEGLQLEPGGPAALAAAGPPVVEPAQLPD